MKNTRSVARISMAAAAAVVGLGLLFNTVSHLQAQQTPVPVQLAAAPQDAAVLDYAGQITRLVQNGRVGDLSSLQIPETSPTTVKLRGWTHDYVAQINRQEEQRTKQYNDAVTKAQDLFKTNNYEKAMGGVVLAYRIAKDPVAFLELQWVKDLTAQVAAKASEYEKNRQWIDSLQLYSDLNTLYEVETRYKADMQRLARRTRLLAVYTPGTLLEIRKAANERERQAQLATQPSLKLEEEPKLPDPANFTKWTEYTERITLDMMKKAIENSQENWVETTSYDTMVKGGIESLRLFLTTPELAKEFPALADEAAKKQFSDSLDGALATVAATPLRSGNAVQEIVDGLIASSARSIKLPREVVIMEFTDGAMEKLDPFTAVIWPHEVPEFEKNMNGEFSGVGIQISLENGQLKVVSPLEDTPAYKAGIEAGDLVTAIDGKSTVGITVDKAVSTITGTEGSKVVLTIKRGDADLKDYTLTRAKISVLSVKGFRRDPAAPANWDFLIDREARVGYIRVTGFQQNTVRELREAVKALSDNGMRGLILDLRFNPGGLLQAAVEMSDMFLQQGVIVSTRGRSLRTRSQENKATNPMDIPKEMPLVVLVNEYSASASEIFAGAMKDLRRGLIVGHRTFGKGSVQNLLPIAPNARPGSEFPDAMMKLTTQYYYLPNGESLHRRDGVKNWGVDPDVVVDLTPDQLAELLKNRRDNDIIRPSGGGAPAPASAPSAEAKEGPTPDTQLETALLMMRLQLVQSRG